YSDANMGAPRKSFRKSRTGPIGTSSTGFCRMGWSSVMKTPPATVVISIQLLCRKKLSLLIAGGGKIEDRGHCRRVAVHPRNSTFDLRSSILGLNQSWERFQEPDEQPCGALQLVSADPFVRSVRLSDVSGAKQNTWNPALGQHPGVAEIIDAYGLSLS